MRSHSAALSLVLCLAACAHQSSLQVDATAREEAVSSRDTATDTVRETHVERGPETITTTVEEFGLERPEVPSLAPRQTMDGPSPKHPALADGGNRPDAAERMPAHGPLVKRTVVVKQLGPVSASSSTTTAARTEDKATDAKTATANVQAKDEGHPELPRCGFGGSVWGLVALGALVLALLGLWKLKKLPFF